MASNLTLIPVERIQRAILLIRGEKVMLDSDLAAVYGVETGALNRAVTRNATRFVLPQSSVEGGACRLETCDTTKCATPD